MARYTGPKSKIARRFGAPIYGFDKALERKNYPPGQHGIQRKRRRKSEFAKQLEEKQKAKYTYGLMENQFRNLYEKASQIKGRTGETMLQLLEARLDNTVFRLGLAPSRRAARQFVTHKHILLNDETLNVPSYTLKPGDKVRVKDKSKNMEPIQESIDEGTMTYPWLEFNKDKLEGKFLQYPERKQIPERIEEHLIVELYSK